MMKALLAAMGFVLIGSCSAPEVKKAETAVAPAAITQFYVSPATIAKGDRALLCYGVEGAVAVRLDPPVDEITPSLARCLEVTPTATSTYTLFASNRAGVAVSKAVQVIVDPKMRRANARVATGSGGLILFFTAPQNKVKKGAPVTLCYGVKGAATVSVTPAVQALTPSERICFQTTPEATTSYVLTAKSADGGTDTETARIVVEP
jgi:predicted phage tail protein